MAIQNDPLPYDADLEGQALWSIGTVAQRTGLSRSTVYRYVRRGVLPQRRRIGPGRVGWLATEIIAWMEGRPRHEEIRPGRRH